MPYHCGRTDSPRGRDVCSFERANDVAGPLKTESTHATFDGGWAWAWAVPLETIRTCSRWLRLQIQFCLDAVLCDHSHGKIKSLDLSGNHLRMEKELHDRRTPEQAPAAQYTNMRDYRPAKGLLNAERLHRHATKLDGCR